MLQAMEDKLYKMTPHKPSVHTETKYDCRENFLLHKYTYFCSYCGEQIRKNSKRHKCGQIHDWTGIINQ